MYIQNICGYVNCKSADCKHCPHVSFYLFIFNKKVELPKVIQPLLTDLLLEEY